MQPKIYCLCLLLLLTVKQSIAQEFSSLTQRFISVKADTLALTHATIVDGTGQPPKTDQTLVIIKGRIASISRSGNSNISPTTKIIDCTGKTIIPGMIMMHEH